MVKKADPWLRDPGFYLALASSRNIETNSLITKRPTRQTQHIIEINTHANTELGYEVGLRLRELGGIHAT